MKKNIGLIMGVLVFLVLIGVICALLYKDNNKYIEQELPKPELSEGLRGKYGIDKNINEATIDNYLNRSDTVYRDVRMLVDTATW